MRLKQFLLFSLISLYLPTGAHAQLWSGIIDPSRAIDWSRGNQGIAGGIPNRTFICATLSPGATAAQINTAIAACSSNASAVAAGGGLVQLNAGTYNLAGGIDFTGASNVTLRGAGPDQTKLIFSGNAGCGGPSAAICVHGSSRVCTGGCFEGPIVIGNWTAGFAPGTTQITLSSTAGLSVGQVIILDQLNDPLNTGGIFVCTAINVCTTEGGGVDAIVNARTQQQYVQVQAISGNVVTISPGIYMPNWRASQSPRAWTWGNLASTAFRNGIENLSIDNTNSGGGSGITFQNAYQNWVKNVRSLNPSRNHIWVFAAARIEVRDSYFYGTKNAASQSYGVETFGSSDVLVINNIFQHITTPIMTGMTHGSVFAYNFTTDMFYTQVLGYMQSGIIMGHDAGVAMNLYEGNQTNQLFTDVFHGTNHFITAFRNQIIGLEPTIVSPAKTQATFPVNLSSFARFHNLIGNLFGTAGYHTQYEDAAPSGTNPNRSVYVLGWAGVAGNSRLNVPNDPLVKTTLFRWGNCDSSHGFLSGNCQFNPAEVPTGLSQFANALPATRTLPASLFLSARPSWWGTPAWPPIGPDVTGGTAPGVGGLAYLIPAQLCYSQMLPDPVYASLNPGETVSDNLGGRPGIFNANTCYLSDVAPAPPTILRVQ